MKNWHVQGVPQNERQLKERLKPSVDIGAGQPFIMPVEAEVRIPTGRKTFSYSEISNEKWDRIFKN